MIKMNFVCGECVAEAGEQGLSPAEYSQLDVGINENREVEVWCRRHEKTVGIITEDGVVPGRLRDAECSKCAAGLPHRH